MTTAGGIRALTLWEPWATAIVIGRKRIETRSWRAPGSVIGKDIAIHASMKKPDFAVVNMLAPELFDIQWPCGCVVAIVRVVECVPTTMCAVGPDERAWGNYSLGRWAWMLDNIRKVDPPVPAKGRQGLWTWNGLYRRNRTPLHLFLEEADEYIPQRPLGQIEPLLLRAWINIVRRGRSRGLGCTFITQRSAAINKNVLTQVQTLIALRTTGPQDRDAIAEWVKYHEAPKDIISSLAGLQDGEAWVWSPDFLKRIVRIRFRLSTTFDSGATPTMGSIQPAATLADVDLAAITAGWQSVIEADQENDPKHLRSRIEELQREVRRLEHQQPEPERVEVEVPVFTDAMRDIFLKAIEDHGRSNEHLAGIVNGLRAEITEVTKPRKFLDERHEERIEFHAEDRVEPVRTVRVNGESNAKVDSAMVAFLAVLDPFYMTGPMHRDELAVRAGYSRRSRHVDNTISALRVSGLVTGGEEGIKITYDGRSALADNLDKHKPKGNLRNYWLDKLSRIDKAGAAMFKVLLEHHPAIMNRDSVAIASGYSVTSRHVDNTISNLRQLGIVTGTKDALRVSEFLF